MKLTIEALRVMLPFLASTAAMLSGYDLSRRVGLANQTCYPLLHRLAKHGLLTAKTERANPNFNLRPARTLYQATPDGVAKAKATLSLLQVST